MPSAVVVGERAYDFRKHIGADRLVERGAEPSISHHAKFPRPAASLDSAVIRRRIRRPSEPGGDREVRGGYRNRRSRDSGSQEHGPHSSHFPSYYARSP